MSERKQNCFAGWLSLVFGIVTKEVVVHVVIGYPSTVVRSRRFIEHLDAGKLRGLG